MNNPLSDADVRILTRALGHDGVTDAVNHQTQTIDYLLIELKQGNELSAEELSNERNRNFTYSKHAHRIIEAIELFRDTNIRANDTPVEDLNFTKDISTILRTEVEASVKAKGTLKYTPAVGYVGLFNLITNAERFSPKLSITEHKGDLSEMNYTPFGAPSSGDFVVFSVADSGPGLPTNNFDELSSLSFSSKGKNSGFGLFAVRKVCDYLHSPLSIKTSKKGTTFSMYQHRDFLKD